MITVLSGSNWYALKSELDNIISSFRSEYGNLAIERLNVEDSNLNNIMSAVAGISLFSMDKMVVINGLSANKDSVEKIDQIITSVEESTHLVIVEKSLDKRSVYYKKLKKLKNYHEYNELSADSLVNWAVEYTSKAGGKINSHDSRYLIERVGANQTLVEREIAKLIIYDKNVTQKSIDELTESNPSSTVFNLVETAFSGNAKEALKIYDEQRALKKEPQAIFGMLVWQMHLVAVCIASGGKSVSEISSETALNSYTLGKANTIAKRMGPRKVQDFLKLLRDIEVTSKQQTYDLDQALRYAIMSLAY